MKMQSKRLSISLSFILTLFVAAPSLANTVDTGTINFTGSIIYAPCSLLSDSSFIEFSCLDLNRNAKTVSINPLEIKKRSIPLTDNKGDARFRWVNPEKNLGLVIINYG